MMRWKTVLAIVIGLHLTAAFADRYELRSWSDPYAWQFHNGPEFPGAAGSITAGDRGQELIYDFSGGGRYVGMRLRSGLMPGALHAMTLTVVPDADVHLSVRLTDAAGRTFQNRPVAYPAGQPARIEVRLEGKWHSAWGGDKERPGFTPPVASVSLQVHRAEETAATGRIALTGVEVDAPPAKLPEGEPFRFTGGNWSVEGGFEQHPDGVMLTMTVRPSPQADSACLAVVFPELMRDRVWRFELDPSEGEQKLEEFIPARLCGNPFGMYRLKLEIEEGEVCASAWTRLTGKRFNELNFSDLYESNKIAPSIFGTQVHFASSTGPTGVYGAYHDPRRLIDRIAEAGFKWIRDNAFVLRNEAGEYYVRESDLEWMRYAREKGIEVITIFRLSANDTVEEYVKKVDAMVHYTRDLTRVYELGNEPYAQGGWRQKYGGPWNAREEDNSTSPWVPAYLTYTNAVADRFRELYPEATIIGLGANTPVNYRFLDLNVSKNLDGVTEHAYTFCLPPEKMPYGWRYEKRDGVRVGDEACTYRGLIEDYHRKFAAVGQPRSLWITEYGFTGYRYNGRNETGLYAGYSEEAQAVYLARRELETLTLDVKALVQYCFIDKSDSRPDSAEANFGLLRGDFSKKPAFYTMQRVHSRLNGFRHAPEIAVEFTAQPLHRNNKKAVLVGNWDDNQIESDNDCMAIPFTNAEGDLIVAVWSKQPYSAEFNNRVVSFTVPGAYAGAVAQDLLTGIYYDVPAIQEEGEMRFHNLSLRNSPLLIRFAAAEE